jgi:tetratricopeptide (TPR) repeat protein/predicted Ser/Thr protein kinase
MRVPEWAAPLCADLRRRWREGDRVRVEHYFASEPRLAGSTDAMLALIDAELAARQEADETCVIEDFLRRFPQLLNELQSRLGSQAAVSPTKSWNPPASSTPPSRQAAIGTVAHPPPDSAATDPNESPTVTIDRVVPVKEEDLPSNARPTLTYHIDPTPPLLDDPGRTTDHLPRGRTDGNESIETIVSGSPPALATLGFPTIGGYVILGELGKGGMGVVYKAEQAGLKRLVALKMILQGADAKPEALVRFRREAEAIARIKHPNIVQVYEIGEHEGQPYFSLEFVEGGSLSSQLRDKSLPGVEAARLCEQIARAVHAAHEAGIVHRDLKPANVLVTADGVPKVTDFGLAKQLDGVERTHAGAIMGTPAYMAPEQAAGLTDEIGPAADTYALGAILYEMLVGRPPFKSTSVLDTLLQVKVCEPVPPSKLQPSVPRDLETICLKCLAKAPARRYPSAAAVADDLNRFLKREPIEARRTPLLERASMWVRRNPWKAGAAAAIAFALLLVVGFTTREIGRRVRLAQNRLQTQELLLQAQEDQKNQRFDKALERLNQALGAIGKDDALADLRPGAEEAHTEVEAELRRQALAREDQDRYRDFLKDRRIVHQNEGLVALGESEDNAAHVREARAAALRALALYGVTLDSHGAPQVTHLALSDRQKSEIVSGCYELLLLGAEAHAVALPGEDGRTQAEMALRLLERSAEFGSASRAFHIEKARFLTQAGRAAEAGREEQLAAGREPADATDMFLTGMNDYRRFRQSPAAARAPILSAAVEGLEKALKHRPDHLWASYFLALCHLQESRLDAAEADLTRCMALQEGFNFPWPYILRGHVHNQRGQSHGDRIRTLLKDKEVAAAEEERRAATRQFRAAEADLAHAETMTPDRSAKYAILNHRAMCHYLEGEANSDKLALRDEKYAQAIGELKQAIALQPDRYQAHGNLAEIYARQEKLTEAGEEWTQVIQLSPQPTFFHRRARVHLVRQELPEALRDLKEAIGREGVGPSRNRAEDHVECGRIYFRQKKFAEAHAAFEEALRAYPGDYGPAHRLKAEALIELGRFAEAIPEMDAYLKTVGKPVADIFRARGLAHAKLRQYDKAVEDYTQALFIDDRDNKPRNPQTLSYRGWAYVLCDAPRLARVDFNAVLRITPGDADALAGRGNARVRLGETKEALADAEAALQAGERSERLRFNAARVYALAAGRAELDAREIKDPVAAERAAKQQRQRCQDRAVQLLDEAVRLVPERERAAFWEQYVETDPALKAIRNSAGYRRLSALYLQAAK